jgi:anti-sigma B factor antagonist
MGIFDSSVRAEEALKELLKQNIPRESIIFFTPSADAAVTAVKELGTYAGGYVHEVAAVTPMMVPGVGGIFALGLGATELLGSFDADLEGTVDSSPRQVSALERAHDQQDAAFFRKILRGERSVILVRTAWHEIAATASSLFDRMGSGRPQSTHAKTETTIRHIDGIIVLDVVGRITITEGSAVLHETVQQLQEGGNKRILLNLASVNYLDTSGIGELVRIHTSLRKQGGQLKLVNLHKPFMEILQMTCLHRVFDIQTDEATAIKSFGRADRAIA